jgi:hypothetical protein
VESAKVIVSFVDFLDEEHDSMGLLLRCCFGEPEGIERIDFGGGRVVLCFHFVDQLDEVAGNALGLACGLLHFGF